MVSAYDRFMNGAEQAKKTAEECLVEAETADAARALYLIAEYDRHLSRSVDYEMRAAWYFKPCAVKGCEKNSHSSSFGKVGYCYSHYARLRRHGEPLAGRVSPGEPATFYEEVVLNHDRSECLFWGFAKSSRGYGKIWVDGKMEYVHRLVCEAVHGPAPTSDHQAAHSCGNGHLGCVAKNHLSWKRPIQNHADKVEHGTLVRGEKHKMAKLTEDQARQVLSLKGIEPQSLTAKRFGVCRQTISKIQSGETWKVLHAPKIKQEIAA